MALQHQQSFPVYVLNLDRSKERWESLSQQAVASGVTVQRVSAVDGKLLQSSEKAEFDEAAFQRDHGKTVLPAEIGCYFSHLKALRMIVEQGDEIAVIVEDDVLFKPDFLPFMHEISAVSGWDMIKMVNHRMTLFRPHLALKSGITLGRCMHGPFGSSAAYVVTRNGAQKLLDALVPMHLPYDVALERGWAGDYRSFTTDRPLVDFSQQAVSTVSEQGRQSYSAARLPWWQRIGTFFFRSGDYLRRAIYALKKTTLKTN